MDRSSARELEARTSPATPRQALEPPSLRFSRSIGGELRGSDFKLQIEDCKLQIGLRVTTQDTDDDALHLAPVGIDDPRLHGPVGGLETDLAALAVEPLEGGFPAVEQGNNLLAV